MYVIPKSKTRISSIHKVPIDLNISQVCKVVRTSECKIGEYALFVKGDKDKDKFSIFKGYISFDNVCDDFELIKFGKG